MTLKPHRNKLTGWLKVHKHVFEQKREQWWELLDGLAAWQTDWTCLRVVGCFNVPLVERPVLSEAAPLAAAVMERRHAEWFDVATSAVSEAIKRSQVFPQENHRRQYIGEDGVVVVVAGHNQLVTCFRNPQGTAAAVRAATRLTSLSQPPPSDA
jgi:hypothetical protein